MNVRDTAVSSPEDSSSSSERLAHTRIFPSSFLRWRLRITCRPFFWGAALGLLLLALNLWGTTFDTPQVWAAHVTPHIRFQGDPSTPNTEDPTAGATSLTRPYQKGAEGSDPAGTPQTIDHGFQPVEIGSIAPQVEQDTTLKGSDGHVELRIPAGAITAQDVRNAGYNITLNLFQIAPASGSNASGSFSFGTYFVQLLDAKGALLTHGLRKPVVVIYHLQSDEMTLGLQHTHFLLNGSVSSKQLRAKGVVQPASGASIDTTMGVRETPANTLDTQAQTLTATASLTTPSSSLSWNGDAPIANFGKPDPSSVDLSSGGLTTGYDIDVPQGPGGLTPPVHLGYSSESVNGQHSYSSAAGWVGEGWNLNLGEITWDQHDVLAGCKTPPCASNWENQWFLNDPYGTSSELIPPNITASTYYDATGNNACQMASPAIPCPILWHTATESHAKIYAYIGPLTIPNQTINPVCWRVWLPNGIMEEFGCTNDSLQYFYVPGGHAEVSGWHLDMITDPSGNQIHLTYQRDMANWTDPTTSTVYSYPRDVVMQSIQYDSPTCHDAQNMCTGSAWAPQMQVVFNASHSPNVLTNTPQNCNTGANLRCDDPLDLSGSGGVAAPIIQNTYVLNTVQVQVRTTGTGSWNTLRGYNLGYEQSGPSPISSPPTSDPANGDPTSGYAASTAGMLDLTQFQELGSAGPSVLLYSGQDNSSNSSYAYMKLFDLSSQNIVVGANTTLSYWIYPQSIQPGTSVSGANSTCVALDMIFSDGSDLRDSGAVDQHGNVLHPSHQCNHLMMNQWNLVTSNIGAVKNGKTISRIDMGYDQPGNTGGYRGYIDDLSLANPGSSTPLFSTDFESGSPQPTWTNTVDNNGGGNSNNIGGVCCGLTGPEAFVGIGIGHADQASLPMVTFTYTTQTTGYVDSYFTPKPSNNCGPAWNTGNGSGCLLWEESYANNSRFLSSVSNGQGLIHTYTWLLAHSNTHGVNGGGSNTDDPFYCNGKQGTYPCSEADDSGWSRAVLLNQSTTTLRLTQSGQSGAQSTQEDFPGTGGWNNVSTLSMPLTLHTGSNSILISNPLNWAPDIDRIVVNGTTYEAEAAANTVAGGAVVYTCSACSGGQKVNFIGQSGTLQFNGVNVSTAGTYSVTLYYLNGDPDRTAQVTVDGTLTPVTSTTGFTYQLASLTAQQCGDCVAGMYWGNQNDNDYLNYYNGKMMGFAQTTVNEPSGAKEVHNFYAGEGWGVYDTGQVTCYTPNPCHNDPWWDLANAAHGHEYQTLSYDTDGTTLLGEVDTTYQAICPPSGVSGTPSSSQWGNWNGKLVSSLDHNDPVAVCDIQQTQQTTKTFAGTSNYASTTSSWTYDSYGRMTQETTSANGGTPSSVVTHIGYVWNDSVTATQTSASGTYLIDDVASTNTEDGSGNRLDCNIISYDGQGYVTGQTSGLTKGLSTTNTSYTSCGNSANSYTPSGPITTTTTYDAYGVALATNDPDANGGISGHLGCTVNSVQHTHCTTYDSTFAAYPVATSNTLNQTSTTSYANTGALFGYGTWPVSSTDINGQTTSYTFDPLGRMTGTVQPGETNGLQTQQWIYTNWCSGSSAQSPCEELDEIDRINSTTTTTKRAFYDGLGRLIETRIPGVNGQDVIMYVYYDTSGRQIFQSTPYFVAAYTGLPGASAYSIPDSTQPGMSINYPNLRQTGVTDPNSHTTTTTGSVVCGVAGTSDSGCYIQTLAVDARGHQQGRLTNALGKTNYQQLYTGNSSGTYALYSTTTYTFNATGDWISTLSPDGTLATDAFDALGREINQSDPDSGTASYTYDPNGNMLTSIDGRGVQVYYGYDGLNRELWRNTTNSPTGAWVTYTYDSVANGNIGKGELTGESFTGNGGLTGSYTFTYDARGQQIGQTTTVNGTNYPLQASYDDNGQLLSLTYPTGEVVTADYSSTGWLGDVKTRTGSTTTTLASNLTYTGLSGASGQIASMDLGNGDSYSFSYDTGGRLTSASLKRTSDQTLLYQTQPTYDSVNNVVGVSTTISGQTDLQQFCYDDLNRLTWSGTSGVPPCSGTNFNAGTLTAAQYQQSDSYNVDSGLTGGPSGTYTYGNSSHPHAVTATSGGYTAAYDAAGNLTCRALTSATTCSGTQTGQQLIYDPEERLSHWQNQPNSPTQTADYLYDGEGNRVAMQTTSSGTTTLTAYIDDVEEVQTSGSTTQTTAYYYLAGQRIAARVNGTFYYFGYDALGSQVVVLNASGAIIGSQLYGPYGNQRYNNGSLPTSIGFTGQRADSTTGLDYYNARYYDSASGAFLTPDWIQGNILGRDPYTYVSGNPETLTDPSGLCDNFQECVNEGVQITEQVVEQYPYLVPMTFAALDPIVMPIVFGIVGSFLLWLEVAVIVVAVVISVIAVLSIRNSSSSGSSGGGSSGSSGASGGGGSFNSSGGSSKSDTFGGSGGKSSPPDTIEGLKGKQKPDSPSPDEIAYARQKTQELRDNMPKNRNGNAELKLSNGDRFKSYSHKKTQDGEAPLSPKYGKEFKSSTTDRDRRAFCSEAKCMQAAEDKYGNNPPQGFNEMWEAQRDGNKPCDFSDPDDPLKDSGGCFPGLRNFANKFGHTRVWWIDKDGVLHSQDFDEHGTPADSVAYA